MVHHEEIEHLETQVLLTELQLLADDSVVIFHRIEEMGLVGDEHELHELQQEHEVHDDLDDFENLLYHHDDEDEAEHELYERL